MWYLHWTVHWMSVTHGGEMKIRYFVISSIALNFALCIHGRRLKIASVGCKHPADFYGEVRTERWFVIDEGLDFVCPSLVLQFKEWATKWEMKPYIPLLEKDLEWCQENLARVLNSWDKEKRFLQRPQSIWMIAGRMLREYLDRQACGTTVGGEMRFCRPGTNQKQGKAWRPAWI